MGYPASPYTTRRRSLVARVADRESVLRRLDWVLLAAVIGLVAIGSLLVWSATRQRMIDADLDPQTFLQRNLLNIGIGLALGLATALFDYRMLRAYAPFVYGASVLGLLAVLSPLGSTINGSHSWIVLPAGFSVQPSEFAKVALCVALPMILAERRDGEAEPSLTDVLLALGVAAVPAVLIMLQPDLGTTIVIGAIVVGVLAVAGTPTRWILGLLAAGALAAVVAIQVGVLEQYQLDRFAAFADPSKDPRGVGYNTNQARIAIGSGGLTGKGLFEGSQTSGKFVPEQQTDFVFTVAGEELGFVGGAAIIVLLGILLWRALRIALRAEDLFGTLMATGIACWFTFQAFENIGMTLGIMPVTGVPLPFVSYGGSSMFANMMAVGLLQNVHMRRYA
ncbi:MAG: rod shape-determining protein RodA [Actinomycetia bacterium]|nr:rod shape-determining protein RodA [Actinomycetes bacterium]